MFYFLQCIDCFLIFKQFADELSHGEAEEQKICGNRRKNFWLGFCGTFLLVKVSQGRIERITFMHGRAVNNINF